VSKQEDVYYEEGKERCDVLYSVFGFYPHFCVRIYGMLPQAFLPSAAASLAMS
jgi:hypothetical protein